MYCRVYISIDIFISIDNNYKYHFFILKKKPKERDRWGSREMDLAAKGDDFEKKAEKKLNGWGIFGSKYEDAADLFDKAANNFKLAKSCIASFPPFLLLFLFSNK